MRTRSAARSAAICTLLAAVALLLSAAIVLAKEGGIVTLAELEAVDGPALLSLAVRFGSTRLIDNEPIGID